MQMFFEDNPECTVAEARVRLTKLESLWDQFEETQTEIEGMIMTDEVQRVQCEQENEGERILFEKIYYAVAAAAQRIIDKENKQQSLVQQQNNPVPGGSKKIIQTEKQNKPKLPELKLPEFSGEYTKWLFFKNSFEASINNDSDLTNPQKYQYLIGVLAGEAREVIEGYDNENYEQAWQLLKNTYDNEMLIIDTHLEQLINFPNVSKEDKIDSMRQLVWHIQRHTAALKSLQQPVEQWDTVILHLAKKKLEYIEQRDWQNHTKGKTPRNMPRLQEFITFITERCHTLRMIQPTDTTKLKQKPTSERKGSKKIAMAVTPSKCKLCNSLEHQTYQCITLAKLSADERIKRVIEKRLCINCLNTGHRAKECRATACRRCSKKHNTILHNGEAEKLDVSVSPETAVVTHCTQSLNAINNAGNNERTSQVILSTAQVCIRDINGVKVKCRALLDPGYQVNLMTTALLQKLKLPYSRRKVPISGVNQSKTEVNRVVQVRMEASNGPYTIDLECLVLPSISEQLPTSKLEADKIIILPKNGVLADPEYKPGDVELLLGNGIFWSLLIGAPRNKIIGQPTLQNTKIGWIIAGNLGCSVRRSDSQVSTCLSVTNGQLQEQLERFWKIESLPTKTYYTTEEKECEKHFVETTYRQSDGRFVVRLPTREDIKLGRSREQAQRRLET